MASGILEGIKVISMGSAWAGPYVGRVLAEYGADVFRISYPGRYAGFGINPELEEAWKKSFIAKGMSEEDAEKAIKPSPSYSGNYQPNNYGFGLDLRQDKGKEIYKRLISMADVVIDGWSPRVMADFGLGYSELYKIKPDIIYLSIPAMGMTGSEKDVRMWGTGCDWLSGLTSLRGYQDAEPHRASGFIVDGVASAFILTAVLAALNYRLETGQGQHIDISQTECATSIMGEAIMDYSMNKRCAEPTGNRHSCYAPHNVYRCKGRDMWVTIAVTSEEEWRCFCRAIGDPEWTKNSKFADMLSRWQNQEELDKLIENWTIQHDHYAVQEILQQVAVPAAAVVNLDEHIIYDPQVKDRAIYHWLTYHDGIADPVFRVPWVLPENPSTLNWCGPYTGQHNQYLLGEILGISEEEISKLVEDNIIGVEPPRFGVT
jgi:crotonobetainyl-CoA:carnitine CoA-transferase CaiB-like acyl-CoA transferase